MRPGKLKKGKTRWNQAQQTLNFIDRDILKGKLLDFGSGVGYFVLEGLTRQYDVYGVDILPGKIKRYHHLIDHSGAPQRWKSRCCAGDGTSLPFSSHTFSGIISWFVFEHIPNPGEVLRELVRILKPGGVLVIRAQDGRCAWEGHCKIPWIPFLGEPLASHWITLFGRSPELRENVYDITQPQLISILENLGCRIIKKDRDIPPVSPHLRNITTTAQLDELAARMQREWDNGTFIPRQDGLYLYAMK